METKVCGGTGYAVEDFRTSLGHGDTWIGVPVQCYIECNNFFVWNRGWMNERRSGCIPDQSCQRGLVEGEGRIKVVHFSWRWRS